MRLLRALPLLVVAALAAASVGGCQPSSREPTSVVLVTIDTLRADRLNPYGYERSHTPTVQRLADEGLLFEHAYTDTTWTIPSVASLLTSRYPYEHGVQTLYDRLGSGPTLAELLRERGYRTAAIVGSFPLDSRFGFARGFEFYDDEMDTAFQIGPHEQPRDDWFDGTPEERRRWYLARLGTESYRPDAEVADRAIAWLARNPAEPFFLWVHFYGPHERRHVSMNRVRQHAIERYDRDVESMDWHLGRLLDAIDADPRADRIALVFHSDHGQTLDEHERFGHGLDLYETTARVPLIVRLPGRARAGERISRVVRNVDILPTLLGLAGVPAPAHARGSDLLADGAEAPDHAYFETHMLGRGPFVETLEVDGEQRRVGYRLRGLRTPRWKLVAKEPIPAWEADGGGGAPLPRDFVEERTRFELYDLVADPHEQRNLAAREPGRVEALREVLSSHQPDGPVADTAQPMDELTRERLRALGYLE